MQVYVGTYAKYNGGSLAGAYLELNEFSSAEEFYAKCKELHKDESDPEFDFQDFEPSANDDTNFELEKLLFENLNLDDFLTLMKQINDESIDKEGLLAYVGLNDMYIDFDHLINDFNNSCIGKYTMKEYLIETTDLHGIPEHIANYIDFDAMANDNLLSGYYYEYNDYLFYH